MEEQADEGLSRRICIVFLTAATVVSGFYTLLRIFLLAVGLFHRIRLLSGAKEGRMNRRWRKLWKLVSETILPVISTLISVTALHGFLYDSMRWMTFSIFAFLFIIIFDYFLFYDRHFQEEGSVIGSLLFSLTSFHLSFSLLIFLTSILHVYFAYKLKQSQVFGEDEKDEPMAPPKIDTIR